MYSPTCRASPLGTSVANRLCCVARLAVNNNHYLSGVLGIKDPRHKQKIMLKAMDAVLFGPPKGERACGASDPGIVRQRHSVSRASMWFMSVDSKNVGLQFGIMFQIVCLCVFVVNVM